MRIPVWTARCQVRDLNCWIPECTAAGPPTGPLGRSTTANGSHENNSNYGCRSHNWEHKKVPADLCNEQVLGCDLGTHGAIMDGEQVLGCDLGILTVPYWMVSKYWDVIWVLTVPYWMIGIAKLRCFSLSEDFAAKCCILIPTRATYFKGM